MKVIVLDESKEISYFGDCKLQSNGVDKCLKLQMLDKDPQEIMISSYDQIYICKKNFLCVFDKKANNNAVIIVFSTNESCAQIFNVIIKAKSRHPQLRNDPVNEEQMFKDGFYTPLIKQIQSHVKGNQELKTILLNFINLMDDSDERFLYMNILAETLLHPSPPKERTFASIVNERSKKNYSVQKLSSNNVSYNDSDGENDEILEKNSNVSLLNEPAPKNSSSDIIYDIVEHLQNGELLKKIIIFTSNERNKCYEYFYHHKRGHCYRCIKCLEQNKDTVIKAIIHEDGSKSFNFNTAEEHVCEPIDYLPENYQSSLIVKPSNFELFQRKISGKMKTLLRIYDSYDRNISYEFSFDSYQRTFYCSKCKSHGTTLSARFIQYNGSNAIELGFSQHRCQSKKYTDETLSHDTSTSETKFSIDQIETSGTSLGESFNEQNSINRKRSFNNIKCEQIEKENDEILLPKKQNIYSFIEPSPPQNASIDAVYDIVEYYINEKLFKKLLYFTTAERKQCYEYFFCHRSVNFRCFKCFAQKKITQFKATIYEDGSKSFNFNTVEEHICQPIDYSPENYESSLIVKPPNFKCVDQNENGKIQRLLIILNSDDRNICYKFELSSEKHYYCCGCKEQGTPLIARLIQYNGSNAIELEHSQHICQPKKYILENL